ncbi:protein kinase domain-containing protein [Lichenicola sp.]|uniref:serine/threonine-protein kinase n=1 Tax=Lichenicola sp. TaxID=2804529 RepID=UPI003B0022D2
MTEAGVTRGGAASVRSAELPPRIGRFEIQSLLGRGAMGVVYRGHDPEIDRSVAIKLVRADLLDGDERDAYLERFRNEAKIAGRCMHANIVGIYDFALFEGNPYLVMEYIDGVGLNQAVARGTKLSMQEAVHIALQVLDALDYAHRFGIVHRDIKPANILLTRQARLKVTDFGISRLASTELTAAPLMIGTPSYMSPEQCTGDPIDSRSDLFSLGSILYELLAGERPFQGISYTETIFKLVNQPHQSLLELRPDLPLHLSEILDKALAKKPADRFADALEFAAALRSVPPPLDAMPTAVSGVSIPTGSVAEPPDADPDLDTIKVPIQKPVPSGWGDLAATSTSGTGGSRTGSSATGSLGTGISGTGRPGFDLDPALVDTIIRRLALRVGPMARVYVRQSLREARSPDMFCDLLSGGIPDAREREGFLLEAQGLLKPPVVEPPAPGPSAEEPTPQPEPALRAADAAPVLPHADASSAGIAPAMPVIPPSPQPQRLLTEEDIRRTIAALAQVIGPIAPQVVRRAVVRAHDRASLANLCENFIPRDSERMTFRALLGFSE